MNIKESYDLTGKTALVTGAARGIGLAIAETLGSLGASIVISDILEKEATHTPVFLHP